MRSLSFTWLLGLLVGCFGTPQPDPPDLGGLVGMPTVTRGDGIDVVGVVRDAEPGLTLVWGLNLDELNPPATMLVAPDGTFRLFSMGEASDVVRLELREGSARSEPVDVVLAEAPLTRVTPALPCLEVEPVLDLGAAAGVGARVDGMLEVHNGCTEEVSVGARLRVLTSPFEVLSPSATIPPGGTAEIPVRFTAPASAGVFEEIAFVEADGPTPDRRAVTLSARGP